jgi:uncharacterized protein with HEPN domain
MKIETRKRLEDARCACLKIQQFTEGLDFVGFSENEVVISAVERQFEIVGEALNKALLSSPDLNEQIPEIRRCIGLRNRLIHGYDTVDDEIIWDIIQVRLTSLTGKLSEILSEK